MNKRDLTRRTGSGLMAAGMLVALLAVTPTASATPDARTTRAEPTYRCQDFIRYDAATTNLTAEGCQPRPPEGGYGRFIVQDSVLKYECEYGGRGGDENEIVGYDCHWVR
ncbi:hypothetical protein [Streptomyces sp. NBC_01483]|uniref:hypothetical protein n=1 Tax=Streptomyces sp. NBC_01483 TaxID=2903883 RepID=UPI002E3166E9|nr:hypothetical protein [Streptomyces sp. NBC_01483]